MFGPVLGPVVSRGGRSGGVRRVRRGMPVCLAFGVFGLGRLGVYGGSVRGVGGFSCGLVGGQNFLSSGACRLGGVARGGMGLGFGRLLASGYDESHG